MRVQTDWSANWTPVIIYSNNITNRNWFARFIWLIDPMDSPERHWGNAYVCDLCSLFRDMVPFKFAVIMWYYITTFYMISTSSVQFKAYLNLITFESCIERILSTFSYFELLYFYVKCIAWSFFVMCQFQVQLCLCSFIIQGHSFHSSMLFV